MASAVPNWLEPALLKEDLYYWTKKLRVLKGNPWSFQDRDYLKQIYRDTSKDQIFVKGRQVEASELAVNKTLHFVTTHPHVTALYTFPTGDLASLFGHKRFGGAFEESDQLREYLIDDGNVAYKQFNNGSHLYLKTAFGGGDKARSIDSDMLVCDEYQDFDANRVKDADVPARDVLLENLKASKYKKTLTFGTPKHKGAHFEQLWVTSTMNLWNVICEQCQEIQVLNYYDNIINFDKAYDNDDYSVVYFGCRKCQSPLNRNNGFWKSSTKLTGTIEMAGYHISQIMVPTTSASDMIKAHGTKNLKGKTIRAFQNEVLGNFYSGSDQPFNEGVLELCYDTQHTIEQYSHLPTFIGIDWGDITTLCIVSYDAERDIPRILYADKLDHPDITKHSDQISALVKQFRCELGVADFGYGKATNYRLQRDHPGKFYAGRYGINGTLTEYMVWDEKEKIIQIDRESAIAQLVDRAERGRDRDGGLIIPWDSSARIYLQEYMDEMKNVFAVQEYNKTKYTRTGPDHFAHALLYAVIACRGRLVTKKHAFQTSLVRMNQGGGGRRIITPPGSPHRPRR